MISFPASSLACAIALSEEEEESEVEHISLPLVYFVAKSAYDQMVLYLPEYLLLLDVASTTTTLCLIDPAQATIADMYHTMFALVALTTRRRPQECALACCKWVRQKLLSHPDLSCK